MSGFTQRSLGRTGLTVSPIGIGGGSSISSDDLRYAFSRGINYFFHSSDLHHFYYGKSAAALKEFCGSGSAVRDRVVLATVSYINNPEKVVSVLLDQFGELGVDYIDVFHWGWVTERDDPRTLFEVAQAMKTDGDLARFFREKVMAMAEVNEELLRRGLVRYVGASFHSRALAREWLDKLDVVMLRYNLAHLGVERGIFPFLTGDKSHDPGLVVFNVAHEGHKLISTPPADYPPDQLVPTIPDCYRYALTNPYVDVVLAGLTNRQEIDAALAAVEKGPLGEEEGRYFREYGAAWASEGRKAGPNPLLNLLGVSSS